MAQRSLVRWAAPAVIALGAAAVVLTTRVVANAEEPLPPRSAEQLLVDLQTARLDAVSGTVVQRADLGLPELPSVGGSGSSDLNSLISGNHTLRLWYAGPEKVRLALLGTLGESDVIRNGDDVWTWSSQDSRASHRTLTSSGAPVPTPTTPGDLGAAAGLTPQEAADRLLAAVGPTTVVTTAGTARIAGRSAYELVLAPRDTASLIGQVRIAIDAEEHVPLRFVVYPKGTTDPAVEVAFTSISFDRPPDSQFTFTPPPGTTVTEESGDVDATHKGGAGAAQGAEDAEPAVSGSGWTTVLQADYPGGVGALIRGDGGQPDSGGGDVGALVTALPRVSGAWGTGRLLETRLATVLVMDSGRVLGGAVVPERLYELAAQPMPAAPQDPDEAARRILGTPRATP